MKFFRLKNCTPLLGILFVMVSCAKPQGSTSKKDCHYIDTYYPAIYKADLALLQKDYQKAYTLYHTAFQSCVPLSTPSYDEIGSFTKCAAEIKDYKTTLTYAKMLIVRGKELQFFENRPLFQGFLNSPYGDSLYAAYPELKRRQKKQINRQLRKKIVQMVQEDQAYFAAHKFVYFQAQAPQATAHEKALRHIFEKVGFPNRNRIGFYQIDHHSTNISDLLLHITDSSRTQYFIPMLRKFVKAGQAPPRTLAYVVDQYRLYHNQPQKFGTFVQPDGSYSNMPVNLKQVDKNRVSIGMPTLATEQQRKNLLSAK